MKVLAVHLDAGRDTNGNPKRVFVLIDAKSGDIVEAIDEGFEGISALRHAEKKYEIVMGPTFETSKSVYRELLRG